jgi:hypothetical protein
MDIDIFLENPLSPVNPEVPPFDMFAGFWDVDA